MNPLWYYFIKKEYFLMFFCCLKPIPYWCFGILYWVLNIRSCSLLAFPHFPFPWKRRAFFKVASHICKAFAFGLNAFIAFCRWRCDIIGPVFPLPHHLRSNNLYICLVFGFFFCSHWVCCLILPSDWALFFPGSFVASIFYAKSSSAAGQPANFLPLLTSL